MEKSILNFDMDIVKANLYNAVFSLQRNEEVKLFMGVKRMYFAGATLCLDINNDVLTLVHCEESIGWFSGGLRRLLDIECMRLMEAIMQHCEIKHTKKWNA